MPLPHAGRRLLQKAREAAKVQGESRTGFPEVISRGVGRRCWVVVMVILLNWMACGYAAWAPPPFNLGLNAAQTACLGELDSHALRAMLPAADGGGLPLSPLLPLRERGKGVPDSAYVPDGVEVVKACALVDAQLAPGLPPKGLGGLLPVLE